MIRHLVQAVFILSFLVFSAPALAAPRSAIALFPNEVAAMRHCPGDTIVWLNTPTRIYHFKGERWYGHTKRGAYVCEKEAEQAGDRASENRQ
ncbi:MAG TPA: hypothetical protein VN788_13555 [Verrucomicrobiae bacterium]|nr:hypothetical protein [Verrucomicrobiae bacterium]